VRLGSYEDLRAFVTHVPASRTRFTRRLSICTKSAADDARAVAPFLAYTKKTPSRAELPTRTDAVAALLGRCPALEELTLMLAHSLAPHVVPAFARLPKLARLSIHNWGTEAQMPMYAP
jgi:hypothetical protein